MAQKAELDSVTSQRAVAQDISRRGVVDIVFGFYYGLKGAPAFVICPLQSNMLGAAKLLYVD